MEIVGTKESSILFLTVAVMLACLIFLVVGRINMKLLDTRWFCGRTNVGIVQVEDEYEGIKYYIASPGNTAQDEEEDAQFIADWGSTFPKDAGDILFGRINHESNSSLEK
jgi:hypothetical protein